MDSLLGGISPDEFLSDYWQKKPLLIRQAVPGFAGLLDLASLKTLAARDDVESRIVSMVEGEWRLDHGPFPARTWKKPPAGDWTLLVSNVNHFSSEATALLQRFDFVPNARLDDLMISFAGPGGSVGPHFDSYDVFLLQAGGRKRWQISAQKDQRFIDDAPIRVLQAFGPEQEWDLEPGDMLYLPPRYAHHGVALEAGMTYSIGFRAPTHQELASQFLAWLQDTLRLDGLYEDPDLARQAHPAEIGDAMVAKVAKTLQSIRWDDKDIGKFLGQYLSEPKPHVYFDPPEKPLSFKVFRQRMAERGLQLDLRSQMLYRDECVFMNAEVIELTPALRPAMIGFADRRSLPGGSFDEAMVQICYEWYCAGYVVLAPLV